MIVCKHSIYRVRKWTDQIELNYKFCFCFFYKNIIFSGSNQSVHNSFMHIHIYAFYSLYRGETEI